MTMPICCRSRNVALAAAQGDLAHAARRAARQDTPRNISAVMAAKERAERAKQALNDHLASH